MVEPKDIDWERYHILLDIGAQREYTGAEQREYQTFLPFVEKLDAEELARSEAATDRLMKRHEETLASLDKLLRNLKIHK